MCKVMAQINDIFLLKKIAYVLKEIRLEHTLTQNDVYYDSGIHIGRIESYKVNLSIATLNTICKYFEISLIDF
jgi:DNA-binding XRE family transcriptional regulator